MVIPVQERLYRKIIPNEAKTHDLNSDSHTSGESAKIIIHTLFGRKQDIKM